MSLQYCIVGGGIVGLATATEILARDPAARILVLEKEAGFGEQKQPQRYDCQHHPLVDENPG